jgi:hypothetical protein
MMASKIAPFSEIVMPTYLVLTRLKGILSLPIMAIRWKDMSVATISYVSSKEHRLETNTNLSSGDKIDAVKKYNQSQAMWVGHFP